MSRHVNRKAVRAQASKNRRPAPLPPVQQTIKRDCPTGQTSYGYGVARALTRSGGEIMECLTCDWYHVRKDEP